jgi:recombination directionality factor gp3-like protein
MTTDTSFYPSGEIAGLTDRPRLVRLGKIRLGVRDAERGFPRATDYFVCPPEVTAVYGEKPRELDIMLPDDDVSKVAGAAYKMYAATRGKICTSDGTTAVRIVDDEVLGDNPSPTQDQLDRALVKPTTKVWSRREIPCPNSECRFFQDNQCKPVMNLIFLLPKVRGLGVFQLDTGSYNSIVDVRGGIELVKRITGGRIAGVPLKLRIKPTTAYPDGKKKNVFTLEIVSMETLESAAAMGEKSLHDVLLPLTEGRVPPAAQEPEEDLFLEEQRGKVIDITPASPRTGASSSPAPAGVAQSAQRTSNAPEKERGSSGTEVAGSTPAPRSEDDVADTFAVAARIEQLFGQLGVTPKDRETWRHLYRGRDAKLVAYLDDELKKKKPKA